MYTYIHVNICELVMYSCTSMQLYMARAGALPGGITSVCFSINSRVPGQGIIPPEDFFQANFRNPLEDLSWCQT